MATPLPDTAFPTITDDQIRENLGRSREYAVAILHAGEHYRDAEASGLIWEHGRRNFALRAAGKLAIVVPMTDETDVCGIAVFDATVDETRALLADDPAIRTGVFTVEVHPGRSFPGDALPAWSPHGDRFSGG